MRMILFLSAVLCLGACGNPADVMRPEDRGTRLITLPNGHTIRAEVRFRQEDVLRGAMFRDAMPEDRGILLLFKQIGYYPTFTYQVRFPLDLLWFDNKGNVVQIVENAPPCPEGRKASECPVYGGSVPARAVLQLAGGVAKKQGLAKGMKMDL